MTFASDQVLGGVANLWKMSKTVSQTLGASGSVTVVTFDRADIDGGHSVIDLANDRFVAPANGLYIAYGAWLWEGTAPGAGTYAVALVAGTEAGTLGRGNGNVHTTNQAIHASWPLSLTSGDFVTLGIDPQNSGVTARGNAAIHLSTSFTLVRIT